MAAPPRPRRRQRSRVVLLVGLAVLAVLAVLVGLAAFLLLRDTSPRNDAPPLDTARLQPGACAGVGSALAETHRLIGDLQAGVTTPQQALPGLVTAQAGLTPATTDPVVGPAVRTLQSRLGLFRLGAATGGLSAVETADLAAAQLAVEQGCRRP